MLTVMLFSFSYSFLLVLLTYMYVKGVIICGVTQSLSSSCFLTEICGLDDTSYSGIRVLVVINYLCLCSFVYSVQRRLFSLITRFQIRSQSSSTAFLQKLIFKASKGKHNGNQLNEMEMPSVLFCLAPCFSACAHVT